MSNSSVLKPADTLFDIKFEAPVEVNYGLTGGHFWDASGIMRIQESKEGFLILHKTDGTFTRISPGWLSYDVKNYE